MNRPILKESFQKLREKGVKLTAPRKAVLESIHSFQKPFSADDIHRSLLNAKVKSCDLASVYRTLNLFEELDLISKCDLFAAAAHYEMKSCHAHHHHIICTSCHRVDPVDTCLLQQQQSLLERLGYSQIQHRLEFRGLCAKCSTAS